MKTSSLQHELKTKEGPVGVIVGVGDLDGVLVGLFVLVTVGVGVLLLLIDGVGGIEGVCVGVGVGVGVNPKHV